jgi:hypothetical protein
MISEARRSRGCSKNKVQFNYERTDFDGKPKLGSDIRDHEDVLITRFQIASGIQPLAAGGGGGVKRRAVAIAY